MKARNPNTGNLETIYVKALDSLPVGSEIDVEGGSDIPVGWEEVTNPDSYSTTEVKTNKTWIDGKPIYRKTWQDTMPVVTTNGTFVNKLINMNVNNIDTITYQEGFFILTYTNYKYFITLPVYTGNNLGTYLDVRSNDVEISSSNIAYNEKPCYVTLEYTKTTD